MGGAAGSGIPGMIAPVAFTGLPMLISAPDNTSAVCDFLEPGYSTPVCYTWIPGFSLK